MFFLTNLKSFHAVASSREYQMSLNLSFIINKVNLTVYLFPAQNRKCKAKNKTNVSGKILNEI